MVRVRKDTNDKNRPSPLSPTHAQHKRAEPQEPTWRRVTPKATPQKVEPQEPAPKDKGKDKVKDVTNIPSSSTSMSLSPKTQVTAWVIRPKVVTQEPTMGKTNIIGQQTQCVESKTEPQEPTPKGSRTTRTCRAT